MQYMEQKFVVKTAVISRHTGHSLQISSSSDSVTPTFPLSKLSTLSNCGHNSIIKCRCGSYSICVLKKLFNSTASFLLMPRHIGEFDCNFIGLSRKRSADLSAVDEINIHSACRRSSGLASQTIASLATIL